MRLRTKAVPFKLVLCFLGGCLRCLSVFPNASFFVDIYTWTSYNRQNLPHHLHGKLHQPNMQRIPPKGGYLINYFQNLPPVYLKKKRQTSCWWLKSCVHQLRLVVYPINLQGFYATQHHRPPVKNGNRRTVSKELLGEWTQVASTRQYCPSQNDINRPLRMAAWMSRSGRDWRDTGRKLGGFLTKTLQV